MVSVTHTTVAVGTDNPNKQISKNAWNEGHTITGTADSLFGFDANGAATEYPIGQSSGNILDKAAADALYAALVHTHNYQPLDSDLTAIASLTTTEFGRAFLALASEAAFKAAVNLEIGTDVQAFSTKLTALAANTVSTQSGTSYTAVIADADTFIRFTSASTVTFTIPPNGSVAFPVGTLIEFSQSGAGALSVAAGSGVTINSRSSDLTLAGQYAVAFVKKIATDTWIMNGDL